MTSQLPKISETLSPLQSRLSVKRDRPISKSAGALDTLKLVFQSGGPGFCQFAINSACNANCGFCNFARDRFPQEEWQFVGLEAGIDAIDILYREGIRYLVFTGGEPTLHPHLTDFIRYSSQLNIKCIVVTNAGILTPAKIHELTEAGLSSFIISVDAADQEVHERNRGLPGVCDKIQQANQILDEIGMSATASVTMSHLVDYEALPDFLTKLGFKSVVFSYPLTKLDSNFRAFSDDGLVTHTEDSLWEAYEKVKNLKKRFTVVNPTLSLEEMQRFVRDEEQKYACLAGYRFFFLDWNLQMWRCHYWHEPMCSIYEFDSSKLVRDGCTKCMINCYRDSSLMQTIAVSVHDAYQSAKKGQFGDMIKALTRKENIGSLQAVIEELPWILRF
ncbi:Radical SAM domain protein [Rippkaea orientalis PCC 8801]|uniref:Radical SAM domain protein n=1 Tax=Rippkaea orientalis (strain PCC 8801 / RF-1) TaxID=41431 RepID=B7JXL1_RIPO1|nr:radical SAM protein [Rippkaea orientalis]ACK64768.1 Radical SAM domain protein [Rippkaea orientalis PCC 8801]